MAKITYTTFSEPFLGSDSKYHYLYRIVNNLNNKEYTGVHTTSNLDDGYAGSGCHLIHAENKYGIENFHKHILKFFKTSDEMFKEESQIVNEEYINNPNVYNITLGGCGGFYCCNQNVPREERMRRGMLGAIALKQHLDTDPIFKQKYVENLVQKRIKRESELSPEERKRRSDDCKQRMQKYGNPMQGKHHSKESRIKMSKSQSGENNSMYGMMWVTNVETNKSYRIPNNEKFEYPIVKGRLCHSATEHSNYNERKRLKENIAKFGIVAHTDDIIVLREQWKNLNDPNQPTIRRNQPIKLKPYEIPIENQTPYEKETIKYWNEVYSYYTSVNRNMKETIENFELDCTPANVKYHFKKFVKDFE